MVSIYCDFNKTIKTLRPTFYNWAKNKAFSRIYQFIHSRKNTGYETQHPSWFKSMKKASSQKKTLIKALDYCDFFSNSR